MKNIMKKNYLDILFVIITAFILYKYFNFVEANRPSTTDEYVFFVYAITLFNNTISNLIIIGYIFIIVNLIGKFNNSNIIIKFNDRKYWAKYIIKNIVVKTIIITLAINIFLLAIYRIPIFYLNKITLVYIVLCIGNQAIGLIGIALAIFLVAIKINKVHLSAGIIYVLLVGIRYINLAFKSIYLTYYEFMFFTSSCDEYMSKLNIHIVSAISIILMILCILNIIYTYCERKDFLFL